MKWQQIVCLFLIVFMSQVLAEPVKPTELWFYYSVNLQNDESLPAMEKVMRRAAAAGYSQMYLTDSKFSKLDKVAANYGKNVERVKALADELHLGIVPGIFPVGYSEALLSHDPNLIESLPVRDALYVVKKGEAHPMADPAVQFPDDGFTNAKHWDFLDPDVNFENGAAHISGAKGKNARIVKTLAVSPFHLYHVRVRIKTNGYTAHPMIEVLSPDTQDAFNDVDLDVKSTQDWTTYDAVFNSLEQKQLRIAFRAGYEGSTGEMWWDQPTIEEAGPVNLIRRDSTPLTVRTEDGKTLAEGKDFEPLSDPKLGQVPWAGSFDVWHQPPVLKTSLPDGTRLRVSFCHGITTNHGKTTICLSEPKTVELLRDQAKRVDALFHAKRYFMEHDEIRVMGWDDACQKRHLDSGAILADNIRVCTGIMKEVEPTATLYVWSDMFDPHHNAHDHYYLVKGNLAGSWNGLDPSVVVGNWNQANVDTLKWFEKRGNHQLLAGYYDVDPEKILDWLKVAKDIKSVDAVMYTTWEDRYEDLEKFAGLVKGASK